MTLTLILTRHAKSSWEDATLDDIDRPLNRRGRLAADAVGRWIAMRAPAPACALVSPARRTRETMAGLRPHLPETLDLREDRRLYEAEDAAALLDILRGVDTPLPLLVLGHNPALGDLAGQLLARRPDHPQFDRFPTGATLVVRFPYDTLADLEPGTGAALAFIVPRDLD
jgi:phosphohistidine phosphatase